MALPKVPNTLDTSERGIVRVAPRIRPSDTNARTQRQTYPKDVSENGQPAHRGCARCPRCRRSVRGNCSRRSAPTF